jgi:alcohol dehydrogenase
VQAIVFDNQLRVEGGWPDPVPAAGECLIRVHLAGICATDLEITKGYLGFRGVLGHEFVGTVVEGSTGWQGKRVVGEINCVCRRCDMCLRGLSTHCRKRSVLGIDGRDGCFAEFVALPETNLHQVPDQIDDPSAVFVEPLAAAHQVLQQCPIEARMGVAVVGSGRLGLLIAQVLARTGCRLEVVGRNPDTLLFCEKKGIMTRSVDDLVPQADRDVVVECTGSPDGLDIALALVRPRGTIVLKSTYAGAAEVNLAAAVIKEVNILGSRCGPFPEAIQSLLRRQVEVHTMISRTFDLAQGVEAFAAAADRRNIKILLRAKGK